MATQLMEISEAPGLFADAMVTDQADHLVFLSLWGRDTGVQEFLARLSLPVRDGGIESFWLKGAECSRFVQVGSLEQLTKLSGRMPRGNLFGDVAHLWLYDRRVATPDRANRRATLLYLPEDRADEAGDQRTRERLWQLVRETCHLPLLPHWQETVIEEFRQRGWLTSLEGIGMHAVMVDLGAEEVDDAVSALIRAYRIGLTA